MDGPISRTQNPILGGASVVGLVYDDGVMIAADNLSSYGSMARFRNIERVFKVNKDTIVGVGGDYADFQNVWKSIEQKQIEEEFMNDGKNIGPIALHTWLTRLHYQKRCKFDPYWIEWLVAGIQNDQPFLGYVDKLGTSYQEKAIGTGRLGQLALPLLRNFTENFSIKLNEQQAREIITKTMEILFLRDCYTSPKFHLGIITKGKDAKIEGPIEVKTNWQPALNVIGYE